MILHCRLATEADIPAMSAIRLAVTENRLSDPSRITLAMYQDHISGRGRSWVCECDGTIQGFASADNVAASIWALFVDPAAEGRGIGRRLLALAVEHLFALGHPRIVLSTGAQTRADGFYLAQGWQRRPTKDECEVNYWIEISNRDPSKQFPAERIG